MKVARRNHSLTAVILVLGAGAIALSATEPLVQLSGPTMGLDLKSLSIGAQPAVSGGLGDQGATLLLGSAAIIVVMGLALLVTRAPGLGVAWRILALLSVLLPGGVAYYVWRFVEDPTSGLQGADASVSDRLAALAMQAALSSGLVHVDETRGFYLLGGGVAAIVLAALLPAFRSEVEDGRSPVAVTRGGPDPGWYLDEADARWERWWDGSRWTGHARPRR